VVAGWAERGRWAGVERRKDRERGEEGLGWAGKRGRERKREMKMGCGFFFSFLLKGCYKTYPL
jgi:hypothetical protein